MVSIWQSHRLQDTKVFEKMILLNPQRKGLAGRIHLPTCPFLWKILANWSSRNLMNSSTLSGSPSAINPYCQFFFHPAGTLCRYQQPATAAKAVINRNRLGQPFLTHSFLFSSKPHLPSIHCNTNSLSLRRLIQDCSVLQLFLSAAQCWYTVPRFWKTCQHLQQPCTTSYLTASRSATNRSHCQQIAPKKNEKKVKVSEKKI